MFDVYYKNTPLNFFSFEEHAETILEAAEKSRTEFFWWVEGKIDGNTVDWHWQPPPWEKTHVHVFPSQWQRTGGIMLAHKKHAQLSQYHFRTEFTVRSLPDLTRWHVPDNIDTEGFDFSWHPDFLDGDYEYRFPTQWQSHGGPIYKGTAGIKFCQTQQAISKVVMENWLIPDNIDVTDFDFSWHPDPFDPPYEYRFPTQWQREGGPVYKGTAGIKYCTNQKVIAGSTQIFYLDFFNEESQTQFSQLKQKYPTIKNIRYVKDHLNVLNRIMQLATTEFVWVISSICDYSNFDFSWHPDSSQKEMIHCFATEDLKRGDTFYINVQSFKTQIHSLEVLDWFNIINYKNTQPVSRFKCPVVYYNSDDLVSEIKKHEFKHPYTLFLNRQDVINGFNFYPCLWSEKDRVIQSFTSSNACCLVPKDAKTYVKGQTYDYPYIGEKQKLQMIGEDPLDIIYISNGEPDEEKWYQHTCDSSQRPVKWIRGIDGRARAYKAAAEASSSKWFFTVFAKLEVVDNFPWHWQPDYFQEPKHYIFYAKNPINGLEYGHMGMIAYNKKLVLETQAYGLDFTLSKAHEVVPLLSGIARYNQNPWMTWRTAFREVVKLKHFVSIEPNVDAEYRLKKWLTTAVGDFAEWSRLGAGDAVEYYNKVNGSYEQLMFSFEWAWLNQLFDTKYGIQIK
jgi:hypothetical protein